MTTYIFQKRQVNVPVFCKNALKKINGSVTLNIAERVEIVTGDDIEDTFRRTIESSNGLQRSVMTDLYRNLVRGNFTKYDGRRGIRGLAWMSDEFPDCGTLRDWEHKSANYNLSGAIVFWLLTHELHSQAEVQMLGAILVTLLDLGVVDTPTMEPDWRILGKIKSKNEVTSSANVEPKHSPQKDAAEQKEDEAFSFPEELSKTDSQIFEGGVIQILVNRYERDPAARKICIDYYGTNCSVCGFNFENTYGEAGKGFIHVHHLLPLSKKGDYHKVDPIRDMRPVCPNCHAMIHRREPLYSIEEMKELLGKK